MKIRKLLRKMIYNAAWWVIKRIDMEAKEPGDFFRWQNMIFFIEDFDVDVYRDAPAEARLTLKQYRLKDILNPKTYEKDRLEVPKL